MKHSTRLQTTKASTAPPLARRVAPHLYSKEPGGAALWAVAGLSTILLLGGFGYLFTSGALDKYFFQESSPTPPTAVATPNTPAPNPVASSGPVTPSSPGATGVPTAPPSTGPAANGTPGPSLGSSETPPTPSAEGFVVTLDSTPQGAAIINKAGVELGKTPQTLVLEETTEVTFTLEGHADCLFTLSSKLRGQTIKCALKPLAGAAGKPPEVSAVKPPVKNPPVKKPPATKPPRPKTPSSSPSGKSRSDF